jgi:ppGpp synthetase/RelA/SpoT-type nucleotidyltranferase
MANDELTLVEHVARQIAAYDEIRPVYEVFAKVLSEVLSRATKDLGLTAIVQARAKDKASFAEKSIRKRNKYPDAVNHLTDLCGARIILDCTDDIELVCKFIREHFENCEIEDAFERLGTAEFGYRSIHFIVALKPGEFETELNSLGKGHGSVEAERLFQACVHRLYERHVPAQRGESATHEGPKFKAEIQIRTLLQHAWAAIGHDRIYKSDFVVPDRWQRDAHRIAASLEDADEALSRTAQGVDGYRNYYGAYMTQNQQKEELEKLEAVFKYDTENMRLAHRIARLALSLQNWKLVEESLKPFVEKWERAEASLLRREPNALQSVQKLEEIELARTSFETLRDPGMAAVLLDYGQAVWQRTKSAGREYLERSIELNPLIVDACVALAETYLDEKDKDTALKWFDKAFQISPEEPRTLAGFIFCKLDVDRDLGFIPLIRPSLEAAIQRCHERASVNVYLPWAYYDAGLFLLLLERPYESLTAYARAVCLTESDNTISKPLDWIQRLHISLGDKLPELDWVRRLLISARVAKLLQGARAAAASFQTSREALKLAEKKLERLTAGPFAEQNQEEIQTATDVKDKASATVDLARKVADAARSKAHAECDRCLSPLKSRGMPKFNVNAPALIVAGGTDRRFEQQMKEYRSLLETSFAGFRGTVFSGGTRAGIPGIVGDLPDSAPGSIRKISCLPVAVPTWTTVHSGYHDVYHSTGTHFSPLESIQTWIDMMACSIDPADVKLLGINGGKIAALEYRLGLMLGATVGVLRDSGRAASALVDDEDWKDAPGLLLLPTDPQTVKTFVQGVPTAEVLDETHREVLAKEEHEAYRTKQKERHGSRDHAMREWEDLPSDLRKSNLNQIDHIEEKLRHIGMKLRKTTPEEVQEIKFSADQIEKMAESEHGRWNLERLRAGWTLGERDVGAKTSPFLVSWLELPDEVKEFDRQPVADLPGMLKKLGYEIVQDGSVQTGTPG